jgi:tetratricopeptide (TPR) repeat protein
MRRKSINYFWVFLFILILGACPKHNIHPEAERAARNCVQFVVSNQLELAGAAAKLALRYNPKYVEAMNCQALVEIRRGDLDRAERILKQALSYDSNFAQARSNLGHIYFEQKKFQRARSLFRSALDIDPSLLNANYNMARTLIALREWQAARDQLLQMLQFPTNAAYAPAHFLLGYIEFERKQYPLAAANFLNAVKLNPRYIEAHLNLCKSLYLIGQYVAACSHCVITTQLDAENIEAKHAIKDIDRKMRPHNQTCPPPQ